MLLITDVTAVTMDPAAGIIPAAAIAIDGDRIQAIAAAADLERRHPDVERLDGAGMVALPGLIDAHAHADQSLLRGRTDDLAWVPFLADRIDPYLRNRDPETLLAAYQLGIAEMLLSGTTCFVSPNVDPRDDLDALTGLIEEMGIRAVLARWADSLETLDTAVSATERYTTGRVRMRVGLDIPRLATDPYRADLYAAAAACRHGLVYHFCSEVEDWTSYRDRFGLRPARWAEQQGILGPDTLLINGCWVDDEEIGILAATGTPVVHSPSANMKMASGNAPVRKMRDAGVTVALGTDGAANNNSFDLIREMKAACLLQNAIRQEPGALTAPAALEMATIEGARALGAAHDLGSLEAGKLADIVLVDLRRPHTWPVTDPVSNLVFSAHGGNVDTVIVGGRLLVRHGRLVGVDLRSILDRAGSAVLP